MGVVDVDKPMASARRTHFIDDDVNAEVTAQGFAVLPQRLSVAQVEDLSRLYRGVIDEVGRDGSGAFLPSMMIQDPKLRARLWDGVADVLGATVGSLFSPGTTEVLGGSFVSKPGSPNSARNPHQDPSVFDETRVVSISLWIPLNDTGTQNGTLWLLPGSHRMGNHVRPPDVDSLDEDVRRVALEESVPVELDAGSMLVIDGAVVHHSPPNSSGEERVSSICALRTVGAAMWYAKSDGGSDIGVAEVHDVGPELYRSGNLVDPVLSDAPLVGRQPYRPASLADLTRSRGAT